MCALYRRPLHPQNPTTQCPMPIAALFQSNRLNGTLTQLWRSNDRQLLQLCVFLASLIWEHRLEQLFDHRCARGHNLRQLALQINLRTHLYALEQLVPRFET